MGLFDGGMFDWGNPNSMALLGMMQGLGQAAMPSRMPVPNGAVFGALAGGAMQGARSGYDMKKDQMQGLLYEAQAAEAKRKSEAIPKLLGWIEGMEKGFGNPGAGTTGAPAQYATSDTTDPGIVPSVGSPVGSGSGRGGWGPLADPAIKALKEAGASDAYIQAQMAHGLAEGGFNSPWVKSGGGENSFGHWQFNAKGELPAYLAWVRAKGGNPQDTAMQALYTMETNEQRQPGITKTGNAGAAMDAIASNFERYQGHGPGQRRGFLADAQRAMSGGALEPRMPIPAARGQLAENVLPAVPNFSGIMAGTGGAAYAPEVPPSPMPAVATGAPADRREEFWAYNRTHPNATLSWDEFNKTMPPSPGSASVVRGADGGLTRGGAAPDATIAAMPAWLVGSSPGGAEKWLNQTSPRGPAQVALPPQLAADLANVARPGPVGVTPLAAPLSLAPGMPSAPMALPAQARAGPFLSPQATMLAKIGSASKVLGFGDIAQPWETAYYGSPAHKAEVEAATTQAREAAGLRFIAPKKTLEMGAAEPFNNRAALLKADLDKRNIEAQKALELANADLLAGRMPGPDGVMVKRPGQSEVDAAKKGAETKAEVDARASAKTTTLRIGDHEYPVTEKQAADILSQAGAPGLGSMQPGGALPFGRNIPAEELRAGQTKARIAVDTKAAEDVGTQATLARRLMPLIDEVVRHADTTPQGWAGPVAASAARGFSAFGISVPPGLTNAELLESVSRQLIPLVREPGATSEKELANYLKAVPGLMQSAEGRKKIAGMMKSVMQGSIDIADVYRENIGSPDLKEKLAKLADERRAKLDHDVSSVASQEGMTATNPKTGAKVIYQGGRWVPVQ